MAIKPTTSRRATVRNRTFDADDLTVLAQVRTLFDVFDRTIRKCLTLANERRGKAVWGGETAPEHPLPPPTRPAVARREVSIASPLALADDTPQRRITDPGYGLPLKQQTAAHKAVVAPRARTPRARATKRALMVYWPQDARRRPSDLTAAQQAAYNLLASDPSMHRSVEAIAAKLQRPVEATRVALNTLHGRKLLKRDVELTA